jgi:LmbE family N-acetylglucosaminyl deacetylase
MTRRVYLSPHLDDAAYSCGGLIYQQTLRGDEVQILTVCSADPALDVRSDLINELHQRWGTPEDAYRARREEDQRASKLLGASVEYLGFLDAIYRRDALGGVLYASDPELFGTLRIEDQSEVDRLQRKLSNISDACVLYSPLGLGDHVDHQLTRNAAELSGRPLNYYWDFPYSLQVKNPGEGKKIPAGTRKNHRLERAELDAWQAAIACYSSQISTFWENEIQIRRDLERHLFRMGGFPILQSS